MHEMALTEGILRILEDNARHHAYTRVRKVWLEIGPLSHAEPEALKFCFEVVRDGTIADGAELILVETPGRAWCLDCGEEVAIGHRGAACPKCGGYKLQITGGDELRVKEMEVE